MDESKVRREQGRRLQQARLAAGFRSARAAAEGNRWPDSTYRAHEAGTRTIDYFDSVKYANAFRLRGASVSGQYILFGSTSDELIRGVPREIAEQCIAGAVMGAANLSKDDAVACAQVALEAMFEPAISDVEANPEEQSLVRVVSATRKFAKR